MKQIFKKYIAIVTLCAMVLCLGACTPAENSSDKAKTVSATVIEIEKYGHAVLDILTSDFMDNGYALGDVVCVSFDSFEAEMPFFDGYYSTPGTYMLRGVSEEKNIAVCINYGDFSQKTGIEIGDSVEITMAEKAGMLTFYELSALKYSNNRADFTEDAVFANFREVTAGSIGKGKLYRKASTINNEYVRAAYSNALIASVGVATVLNLADSTEDIEAYCKAEDFNSEYYRDLYESGKVIALDLNVNFFSEEFGAALVEGFCFLAKNNPPYSVHCTEGKDRAGFTIMLLEALMGAELQEIIDDYMTSFYNYYGIEKEKEPERYETILRSNLYTMLYYVTGTDTEEALAQTDLEAAVTKFLINKGMKEQDILALKEKLR